MNERGRLLPFSTFKAAWRELVDMLGGGRAIERARVIRDGSCTGSLVSRYGLVHESTFPPVDVMFDVERAVVDAGGRPEFLHAYADALGFVVVPRSAMEKPVETIDQAIGPVAHAVGECLMKVGEVLRDGVATPTEAAGTLPSVRRAEAEIHELAVALEARAARGPR